jgi:hypothetical protein
VEATGAMGTGDRGCVAEAGRDAGVVPAFEATCPCMIELAA